MNIDTDSVAARFNSMAGRICLNKTDAFGGAFVVVPPAEGGDVLETLILDSKTDAAQFWQMLLTKCQMMIATLDAQQRQNAFGGRR